MIEFLDLFGSEPNKTCFILKGNQIMFDSSEKGVKPLLDFYEKKQGYSDLIIVDKIVGKGAMMIAILTGAKKIVTFTMSEAALAIAQKYDIETYYETLVPYIINREKNGPCPIEAALKGIDDIVKGYETIKETLKKRK